MTSATTGASLLGTGGTILTESEQILEDLCFSNGITLTDHRTVPPKSAEKTVYLEMFFNGFSQIMHLEKFPNLTELKIIAQELTYINGVESCTKLTELWVAECKLIKISGLDKCRNLKKLYLYSNKLTRIQNLDQLNLQVLWLNDNKLTRLEGFNHMSRLVELNLAQNYITSVGEALKNLDNLEYLNLASNLLDNFQDLTNLQELSSLKHLSLKDPQYGYNPVTILCNYSLYVMYHLPGLQTLDTLAISQKAIKELADSTINKKKLWYFMRLTTISRQMNEMIEKINSIKKIQSMSVIDQMNSYTCRIKDIQKQNFIRNPKNKSELKEKEKEDLIKLLEEKVIESQNKLKQIDVQYDQCMNHIMQEIEVKKRYVLIELENGGNIKFEFSNYNDSWFKSCHELLMSRFCASDYILRSISGIKMRKVIRVTNRLLLAKYEENILADIDENDYINNKPSLRKKVDYLMYCWRPNFGNQFDELFDILKNGFKDPIEYKKHGYEEAIPFSNSMSVCDYHRIDAIKSNQNSKSSNFAFKHGYAILCKVFTSRFMQFNGEDNSIENYSTETSINTYNYPDCYGVRRKFRLENQAKTPTFQPTTAHEYLESQRNCDCKSKQTEWFLFNKNLAVPEYIIEFEYLNKLNFENVFDFELHKPTADNNNTTTTTNNNNKNDILASQNATKYEKLNQEITSSQDNRQEQKEAITNEDILNKELQIQSSLSDCDLATMVIQLEELNLHNCGLTSLDLEAFKNLINVRKLSLSFNNLKSIKEIVHLPSLEHLDVSFNQIETLVGIKVGLKLNHLDVSENQLCDILALTHVLKSYCPNVNFLNILNNLFKRPDKLKSILIYSLKNLTHYNNEPLEDYERRFPDSKHKMNKTLAKKNGYCIEARPRSLHFSFVTDLYIEYKNDFFDNLDFTRTNSFSEIDYATENYIFKISTLNLDGQELFKLANMDYLVNLKWASFSNNYITRIEGLEKCTKLEELSFENNLLQSLTGLENLENLRKLNVNNNEIVYFDESIGKTEANNRNWDLNLNRLTFLAISNNKLTSIKFLQKFPSIVEFYASFNQLKNIRDIFHLKSLNSLAILDLWCNPMCSDPKYRLFVIYHLKTLKSVDGSSIEPSEFVEAKDQFGGKLTCDFIAEKFFHSKFNEIKTMEFPQCGIRQVDFGHTISLSNLDQFDNLRSLNLENNSLASMSGIIYLKNLKILCLNNNKIECIFSKSKSQQNHQQNMNSVNNTNSSSMENILPCLEVLHLAYNGITDIVTLQIGRLTSLKALFLQGNEITKIEGLENLRELRELVLDKNKIKHIAENSFIGQAQRLFELHIEENRLRDLSNLHILRGLHKLYAANNKISEFSEIDRLLELNHLLEISLINNPISRRPHYRITIVFRLRRVKILDMIEVNDEDRIKAEIYFNEQQQLLNQPQIYYNGIVQQAPQMISTSNNNGQLDHQLYSITQSPRLKPITIVDKQLISNVQTASNSNNKFRGQNNNNNNNCNNNVNNNSINSGVINTNNINNNVNISNINNNNNLSKMDKMSKEMGSRYRNQY